MFDCVKSEQNKHKTQTKANKQGKAWIILYFSCCQNASIFDWIKSKQNKYVTQRKQTNKSSLFFKACTDNFLLYPTLKCHWPGSCLTNNSLITLFLWHLLMTHSYYSCVGKYSYRELLWKHLINPDYLRRKNALFLLHCYMPIVTLTQLSLNALWVGTKFKMAGSFLQQDGVSDGKQ